MSKFNLQSLGFALLVLVLALFGKRESGEAGFPITSTIEATSLTAQAIGTIPEVETQSTSVLPASASNATTPGRDRLVFELHPAEAKPKVEFPVLIAKAAGISELGNPVPLYSVGYRNRWPIASLTKLMTAAIVLETLDPTAMVTISEAAAAESGDVGSIRSGEIFTVADLTKAMLVGSSNDAAVALAEAYGYQRFLDAMRSKAFSIGMTETTFMDPSGISVLNQSTVEDLSKLANFIALNHRSIFELTSLKLTTITERNSGSVRTVGTTNFFAGSSEFFGGKTGYTSDAIGNLLSIFTKGNQKFLVIVLGTTDRFGETELLWNWAKKSQRF